MLLHSILYKRKAIPFWPILKSSLCDPEMIDSYLELKSIVAIPVLTQKQKEDIMNLPTQAGGDGAEAS